VWCYDLSLLFSLYSYYFNARQPWAFGKMVECNSNNNDTVQ
jgi:hypothetical protein